VEKKLQEEFSRPELKVEMTGFIKLMTDMEVYLMNSQIKSFSVAFVVITLMMMLLLRSLSLSLFSMIPNVAPIVFGLGAMGATGIALDPGTVMIGSIALGLVVDDTVHFLVRYRSARRRNEPMSAPAVKSSRWPLLEILHPLQVERTGVPVARVEPPEAVTRTRYTAIRADGRPITLPRRSSITWSRCSPGAKARCAKDLATPSHRTGR